MKKLLTLLLLAAAFVACKKEEYSAGEYYTVSYQTLQDTMKITLTGTQNINPANYKGLGADVKFKQAQYVISMNDDKFYKINFIKLDGSVFPLELRVSEQMMHLNF